MSVFKERIGRVVLTVASAAISVSIFTGMHTTVSAAERTVESFFPERPIADINNGSFLPQGIEARTNEKDFSLALRFVETTGLYRNLSLLLLNEIKQSSATQEAIGKLGFPAVQQLVIKAIKHTQAEHAQEWNQMLASVYLVHFKNDELVSIMNQKEKSPYFSKMISNQQAISGSVATKGKAIFQKAHTHAKQQLKKAFAGSNTLASSYHQ